MKQINVEGSEIALKNSNGDIVIVPKKDRSKVEQFIKTECWGCVDNYVSGLPTMSDYAQDGTVVPSDIDPITGSPYSKKIVHVREKDNIKEYDVNSAEYKKLYYSGKLKNYRFDTKSKVYEPLPVPDPNKENSYFWKANNSVPAAIGKIFDPSGISSYPDVYKAWSDGKQDYHDLVEPLGALPVLGEVPKIFKLTKAITNADKAAKVVASAGKVASKVEKAIPNTLEYMGELNKYLPRKSPALDMLGKTGKAINKSSDNVSKYVTNQLSEVFSTKGGFTTLKGLTKADKINTAVHVLNTANLGADITGTVKAVNDNQQQVGIDWDKAKAIANPFNWGVDDYSSHQEKSKAFAAARKDGKKEFMFNNQRYNTRKDTDSIHIEKNSQSENLKQMLDEYYPELVKVINRGKGVNKIGYKGIFFQPYRANYNPIFNNINIGEHPGAKSIAHIIAELSHTKNTKHSPFNIVTQRIKNGENVYNTEDNEEYYVHRLIEPGIAMTAYGNLRPQDIKRIQKHLGVKQDGYFGEETYKALQLKYKDDIDFQKEANRLGKRTSEEVQSGKTNSNRLFDESLARHYLKNLSKEVPIKNITRDLTNEDLFEYDARGKQGKRKIGVLDYSDEAVLNIDPNDPSSFNTEVLQSTLVNNGIGVSLPKSKLADSEVNIFGYDGIYGDETKQALIKYQNQIKEINKRRSSNTLKYQTGGITKQNKQSYVKQVLQSLVQTELK